MKRFFLFSVISLAFGILSCNSCTKVDQIPPPVDASVDAGGIVTPVPTPSSSAPLPPATITFVPATKTEVVSEENWQFTLPSEGWRTVPSSQEEAKVTLLNTEKSNMVLLIKEPYAGSYQDYVLVAARGLKDSGGTLISSKQVTINGNNFVVIESSKSDLKIWLWLTVKNGYGYGFSCGGSFSNSAQHDICTNIASSLKIN